MAQQDPNENGVEGASTTPVKPSLIQKAKANIPLLVGIGFLLLVAVTSIVHHWHMGG